MGRGKCHVVLGPLLRSPNIFQQLVDVLAFAVLAGLIALPFHGLSTCLNGDYILQDQMCFQNLLTVHHLDTTSDSAVLAQSCTWHFFYTFLAHFHVFSIFPTSPWAQHFLRIFRRVQQRSSKQTHVTRKFLSGIYYVLACTRVHDFVAGVSAPRLF